MLPELRLSGSLRYHAVELGRCLNRERMVTWM